MLLSIQRSPSARHMPWLESSPFSTAPMFSPSPLASDCWAHRSCFYCRESAKVNAEFRIAHYKTKADLSLPKSMAGVNPATAQFLKFPHMIGPPRLHGWCDAKRLVNPAVVVVHEVQGNLRRVVLNLFAERICQPSKPPHPSAS